MPRAEAPFIRFHKKFKLDKTTGCWVWRGGTWSNGYGKLKAFGSDVLAHRFGYELYRGPIPDGQCILHQCDNRACVNPDHMRTGSHQENMREAAERSRMPSGDKHWMRINGNPRKGAKSRQSLQVRVLGRVYGSLKEAEKALGLGSGTVRYWINQNRGKAEIITRREYLMERDSQ